MKKYYFPIVLFAATLFTVACGSKKNLPATTATETNLEAVSAKYPGYTQAQFQEGKSLYLANCGSCHGLKNPTSYSEDQWNKIVPKMVTYVNGNKANKLDLNAEVSILKYLVTMTTIAHPSK